MSRVRLSGIIKHLQLSCLLLGQKRVRQKWIANMQLPLQLLGVGMILMLLLCLRLSTQHVITGADNRSGHKRMRYLLDTDWIIQVLAGRKEAVYTHKRIDPHEIALSYISLGEIYE